MSGSVLGDISNFVQSGRGLGKVPASFSFKRPQSQQSSEIPPASHFPVPSIRRSRTLSSTGSSLLGVAAPKFKGQEQFVAAFQADAQDPQRVSEYAADIFAQHVNEESLFLAKSDYMEMQDDINSKMRAILIDWLVEVQMKYRLKQETLFLTVNIIDRYLSVRQVMRKKLQLVGVVAMLVAAKYEEIDPPKVQDFGYITDHTYSRQEIVNMESTMLMALEYQIAVPTPMHFCDRLQRANGCDEVHKSLMMYALELALMDYRNLRYPPSVLVASALLMSNEFLGRRTSWPEAMIHHTKHCEALLRPCTADLRNLLETAKTASLQAVRRKYQLDMFQAVANMRPCVQC